MKNIIEIINPLKITDWDNLVSTSLNYNFFHSSSWASVLVDSYQYKPSYFCCFIGKRLAAVVPVMEVRSFLKKTRGVSLPFSDVCAPILASDIDFDGIFSFIIEYGRRHGWKYFEAKGWNGYFQESKSSDYCFEHTLELDKEPEKILNKFRNSTKRNIKKASKADLEISLSHSFNSVVEFYNIHCRTRKEHGLPPQPFKFFKKIFENIISLKKGIVILANYNSVTIAGAIYFFFGKKAIFKYGASNKAFQRKRANNLIMWKAIEYCCLQGFDTLSLGKTEPTNSGLLQFKRGWGVTESKIFNFKYMLKEKSFVKPKSLVSGKHNKVFSKLPIPILRLIGNLIYKYVA